MKEEGALHLFVNQTSEMEVKAEGREKIKNDQQ
jgi:hypothetical protein